MSTSLVTTNAGELLILKWALQATSTPENLVLHLYQNNYVPTATSALGNFTECTFTNYTTQAISRATWGNPSTVSGAASSTYGASFTWTCGSTTNTVYGYYVTGATSTTTVVFAGRFDTPRILTNGSTLTVDPFTFTLDGA